jgi:hypothetical protein
MLLSPGGVKKELSEGLCGGSRRAEALGYHYEAGLRRLPDYFLKVDTISAYVLTT